MTKKLLGTYTHSDSKFAKVLVNFMDFTICFIESSCNCKEMFSLEIVSIHKDTAYSLIMIIIFHT